MRILHISTRLILGGSQENTVLSCEGQALAGHEVHLAYGPIYGPEGSLRDRVEAFRTDDGRGVTLHLLPHMVREIAPWSDWRARRECRRLIRTLKPDVVHTHSSKAGVLGRAAGWKEGGRGGRPAVVHTIHGLPFHPYQSRAVNALYVASERFAARRCHRLVTVCDAMREQALAAGVGRREQYQTIYSGMEVEAFLEASLRRTEARRALEIAESDFVIGTVARLAELKGHDDLLDALGETLARHPDWKLLWVGDGWWRERLEGRIAELGISDQVMLTGLVPPERVPMLMAAMDVLVHPSYREGLPRTVPQALLAGTPVVAYDLDGTPEVCIDGETGRLVRAGDLAGLREAVVWMADNPGLRRQMAARGQEQCRERFSAERMVDDLLALYQSLLEEKSPSTRGSAAR